MQIIRFLTLLLLLCVWSPTFARCAAQHTVWVNFSNETIKDKFSITIHGEHCSDLTQQIYIHDANGELLYTHTSQFIDGIRTHISQEFIEFIVQFSLHENFFKPTSTLPDWKTWSKLTANSKQQLFVSQQEYSTLKQQHWPMFSYQNGKEQFQTIVYDRAEGKVINIMNGSAKW